MLTKRTVVARVRHWRKRLGLADWDIAVEFGTDAEENEATCSADPEYQRATVRFDLKQIPAQRVDAYVIHELCHAVTWPLANAAHTLAGGDAGKEEWIRTVNESVTTHLEKVILKMASE